MAKPARRSKLPWIVSAAVVVLAAVALFLFYPKKTVSLDRKSIAVLPFKNLSESKEDEFFSDGITEDIITQISKISELKVISRTSVMQYKGVSKRLRDIGQELGVATVLEGSVRRANNEVRIVAQLIDANTDEHLWAETYDKELTKIFAIQSEIAQQIAAALKAKLAPSEKERIEKKPTENLDAYAYYLKGREYYYRYRRPDNENAIELFKKALELDPDYALASAGLTDAYGQRVDKYGFPRTWADSAIALSKKAISIDPGLAEAYKALGLAYEEKGWFQKALEANRKAVELNPNYYPAVGNIGWVNWFIGHLDEALPWMKKSVELNPLGAFNYFGVGVVYLDLGDDVKAQQWFSKALELQPDLPAAHVGLTFISLVQGDYQQAVQRSEKILSVAPEDLWSLGSAGYAHLIPGDYQVAKRYYDKAIAVSALANNPFAGRYITTDLGYISWKMGQQAEAQKSFAQSLKLLQNEMEKGNESFLIRYDLASINATQGNEPEAYKWLKAAIDAGWQRYRLALVDPFFENLRNDAQFKQMMAQVKAKVEGMRKSVEQMEKE